MWTASQFVGFSMTIHRSNDVWDFFLPSFIFLSLSSLLNFQWKKLRMDKLLSTVHLKHFPLEVIEKSLWKTFFRLFLSLTRAHNFFIVRSRLLLLSSFVKCFKHDMPYTQVYVFYNLTSCSLFSFLFFPFSWLFFSDLMVHGNGFN